MSFKPIPVLACPGFIKSKDQNGHVPSKPSPGALPPTSGGGAEEGSGGEIDSGRGKSERHQNS